MDMALGKEVILLVSIEWRRNTTTRPLPATAVFYFLEHHHRWTKLPSGRTQGQEPRIIKLDPK